VHRAKEAREADGSGKCGDVSVNIEAQTTTTLSEAVGANFDTWNVMLWELSWAEEMGAMRGLAPLQYLWSHPCYWPLLENAKSASNLAAHLGHD